MPRSLKIALVVGSAILFFGVILFYVIPKIF